MTLAAITSSNGVDILVLVLIVLGIVFLAKRI